MNLNNIWGEPADVWAKTNSLRVMTQVRPTAFVYDGDCVNTLWLDLSMALQPTRLHHNADAQLAGTLMQDGTHTRLQYRHISL